MDMSAKVPGDHRHCADHPGDKAKLLPTVAAVTSPSSLSVKSDVRGDAEKCQKKSSATVDSWRRKSMCAALAACSAAAVLLAAAALSAFVFLWLASMNNGYSDTATPTVKDGGGGAPSSVPTPSPKAPPRLTGLYILERLDSNFGAYLSSLGLPEQVSSMVLKAGEVVRIEAPSAENGIWHVDIKTGKMNEKASASFFI
jgi:hypothetical protein